MRVECSICKHEDWACKMWRFHDVQLCGKCAALRLAQTRTLGD